MKVSFNPVSFRASDNYQNKTNDKESTENSTVVGLNKGLEGATVANNTNLLEAFKSQLPNFEAVKEADGKEQTPQNKEQKIADYKAHLNDENWEKLYSKEDNTIYLKEKNKFDGSGYVITSDGTVKEVGADIEPSVLVEKDTDSEKLFENKTETEQDTTQTKKKTTLKDKIANVWKFFASFGQMAMSTAKGIGYGAATAVTMLAGSWVFNTLPKAFAKEGPKFAQIVKHPLKHIGTSGKVLAGVGAAAVLAYHLIVGKMAANQKTAVIDHKMYTGHRDV